MLTILFFIDVGASSKKVEGMGINVGTVVTFKDELMEWVKLLLRKSIG
jgi:putative aminopeptidase FrvX